MGRCRDTGFADRTFPFHISANDITFPFNRTFQLGQERSCNYYLLATNESLLQTRTASMRFREEDEKEELWWLCQNWR